MESVPLSEHPFGSLAARNTTEAGKTVSKNSSQALDPKWKASLDFEAMFLGQMMKSMRSTLPESEMTKPSQGREIFTEMLDQQYATLSGQSPFNQSPNAIQNAKSGTSHSLASQIYRSLIRQDGNKAPELDYSTFKWPKEGLGKRALSSPGTPPLWTPVENLPGAPRINEVHSSWPGSKPSKKLSHDEIDRLAQSAGLRHGVSPDLVKGVIRAESAGDTLAVSPVGAKGLMQLMDGTANELGVSNSFDPEQNVDAGTRYLRQLLDRFGGDTQKALAGYNAGPGAVEKHGGVPPYRETQAYVNRILTRLRENSGLLSNDIDPETKL